MNKWSSVIVILVAGCIEPYPAPDVGEKVSILVVDGFINATDGSATVRMTKAVPLIEEKGYPAEKGADVTVHSETGDAFTLVEGDSGRYSAYGLSVDPSTKYQLRVHTSDNRDYISDFMSVMQTPPIDSITWRAEEDGITILANTHDDTKNSRYYLWDYTETWQYQAPYPSAYRNRNQVVITLSPEEIPYVCYRTKSSKNIIVGSTVRLSDDVVRDFPLTYIQAGTSRITILYSILVRQRVIDRTEYEFMQALQRVTESVGGLFDAQPYEILGNIHSNDPSIPVLGFFSAGMIEEKRKFVRFLDLPKNLQKWNYSYCHLDTVCNYRNMTLTCITSIPDLPENSYIVSDLNPIYPGYLVTEKRCADCRVQGGVLEKPDFWP